MLPRYFFSFCLMSAAPLVAVADETDLTDQQRELFDQAAGILKHNCLKCHSGRIPRSHLNLSTRAGILAGGELGGAAYDADDPPESNLVLAINYTDFMMPPTEQMSPKRIQVLMEWVQQGLPWPADPEQLEYEPEPGPPVVNDETKKFWSFQPVQEPPVPPGGWGHNPIDAFIARQLDQNGLAPSGSADARTLVRRMSYDLTGLPMEPTDVDRWVRKLEHSDGSISQSAVRELVDSLLESPRYGEQWGRHWLDLVRYAETNSYERDGAKPFVWRYRDYVIQSFNDDKPYDRFVTEQLAGDELAAPSPDSIVATGYYRLGPWDDEPSDPMQAFYDEVDDIVGTTSQTFLGLTLNCARCHDHKIDPIPQRDYYRMVGFFHNIRRYGIRNHDTVLAASVREIDRLELNELSARNRRAHQKRLDETQRLMDEIEQLVFDDLTDVEKDDFQYIENRAALVTKREGGQLTKAQGDHYRHLCRQLKKLNDNRPNGLAKALCVTEDVNDVRPVHVLQRGNPHAPGEEVTPGFPSVLSPPEVTVPAIPNGTASSGRRILLARWIASPDNPLTARVMVNRIWQYHFGRGIVRLSSDFGFQGTPPTHPQLLDWLATRFVNNGWSVKQMHHLIMTSATYQMASSSRPEAWEKDPVNDLFWRFDVRRLTAEEIRDSILWATGSLNTDKMYGPAVYTEIPDEVKAGQSRPGSGWGTSSAEDRGRRSIYVHVKRSLIDPLLESFDFADTDQTCPVRFVTTQPTQALGLLNSSFMQDQAEQFAELLRQQQPDSPAGQVRLALARVTQRPPSQDDIRRGTELMEALARHDRLTADQALRYFCLVALNLNEFIYLD